MLNEWENFEFHLSFFLQCILEHVISDAQIVSSLLFSFLFIFLVALQMPLRRFHQYSFLFHFLFLGAISATLFLRQQSIAFQAPRSETTTTTYLERALSIRLLLLPMFLAAAHASAMLLAQVGFRPFHSFQSMMRANACMGKEKYFIIIC